MTALKWGYAKPHPPAWVIEAFSLTGKEYEYIANSVAYHIVNFLKDAVGEIEAALPGTQDTLSSQRILTAHQQRVAFFKMAIWHADYFRPKNTTHRDGKPIHRPKATDDLMDQQKLRLQIAKASTNLAKLLRQHQHITDRLGVLHLDCDPLELIGLMDRRDRQQNVTGYLVERVRDEFDSLLSSKGHPYQSAQEFARLIDILAEKTSEPDWCALPTDVLLGVDGHKHMSHFYLAFDIWLSGHPEEDGGFVPAGFSLSPKCWAAIITSLLGVDVSDNDIVMYRKRWKERVESVPKIDPTSVWSKFDRTE